MAQKLDAPMPGNLDLGAGYTLRATALDPTTGALVPGVTIDTLVFTCEDLTGQGGVGLQVGPYMLVPGPGA